MTIYLIIISIVAAFCTLYDKSASKSMRTRVPERILMAIAAIGGALSMFLVMLIIRHKTRKPLFMVGLPILTIVHVLLFLAFI